METLVAASTDVHIHVNAIALVSTRLAATAVVKPKRMEIETRNGQKQHLTKRNTEAHSAAAWDTKQQLSSNYIVR